MHAIPPFHLAFPVHDLDAARAFYGGLLGCPEGRSSDEWIDFDFFGHQIVAHLVPGAARVRRQQCGRRPRRAGAAFRRGAGDGGVGKLAARLKAAGVDFAIPPTVRFKGEPGEQATMFFRDPSGNALEIKAMANPANLFAR